MVDKEKAKCNVCGKSFYSRKQLEQHAQDAHSTMNKNAMIKAVKKPFKISKLIAVISVCVLIAIIGSIAIYYAREHAAALTIDGIGCNSMEQFAMHIHAHIDIIINGAYFLVPSQIGIPSNCFYWLHTHDESGKIHIEAPMLRDFTLGQFFDIWNKKLSNDQYLITSLMRTIL